MFATVVWVCKVPLLGDVLPASGLLPLFAGIKAVLHMPVAASDFITIVQVTSAAAAGAVCSSG